MIYFILLISGLLLGSFSNMLIYRLPNEKSLFRGRSYCPFCNQDLALRSLMPVISYIIQKGRCLSCRHPIPIRYLLVECLMPSCLILCYLSYDLTFYSIQLMIYCWICIILFFSDLETSLLPTTISFFGIIMGLIWTLKTHLLFDSLMGMGSGIIIYGSIALIAQFWYKKPALGQGDIILIGMIGAYWGLKIVIITCYLSFLVGGVIALFLLLTKRKSKQDHIPFAPAIIIASYLAIFYHNPLYSYFLGI